MEKYSFLNDIPPTPELSDRDVLVIGKFTVIEGKTRFIGHTVTAAELKKDLIAGAVEDANLDYYVEQAKEHAESAAESNTKATEQAEVSTNAAKTATFQAKIAKDVVDSIKETTDGFDNAINTLHIQQTLSSSEINELQRKKLDIDGKAKSAETADAATKATYLIKDEVWYTPDSFASTNGFVAPASPSWHPKTLDSSATSFFVFIQNTSAATSSTYVQCRLISVADNIYINFSIAFKMDNGEGINAMLIIESATPEAPDLTASIGKSIRDRKSPSLNISLSRALNNPLFSVTAIHSSVARLGDALYVDNGRDVQIGNNIQATIIKL